MMLAEIKDKLPSKVFGIMTKDIATLRPAQEKAIQAGLLESNNLLICTPTASGKTLIAEFAMAHQVLEKGGKAIYIVPLKALANEKFKHFKKRYDGLMRCALSIGDLDAADTYLAGYDIIICTAEKLDSLLRHHAPWLPQVNCVVVDEIHMLNDPGRGPTLEILITMLKQLVPSMQLIGLSATIGNPEELAAWLEAELVKDDWRPVELKKGTYFGGEIEFPTK